jgi:hypothetical protein
MLLIYHALPFCHLLNFILFSQLQEYEVREKPTLNTWMQGGLDYIMLQFLNTDGIRMIGSVLGQSIALDYYGRQVWTMIFFKCYMCKVHDYVL